MTNFYTIYTVNFSSAAAKPYSQITPLKPTIIAKSNGMLLALTVGGSVIRTEKEVHNDVNG
jgi:hypothetical protein